MLDLNADSVLLIFEFLVIEGLLKIWRKSLEQMNRDQLLLIN